MSLATIATDHIVALSITSPTTDPISYCCRGSGGIWPKGSHIVGHTAVTVTSSRYMGYESCGLRRVWEL